MGKRVDLLKDDVKKIFIKYLIPSIAGMIGLSLNILFDTIFVGRGVGSNGLAALNIVIPIFNVFSAMALLLGIGGATAVSVSMGKKEYDRVNRIFTVAILVNILIGSIITVLSVLFINKLCYGLGATEEIFSMVKSYLGVIVWFSWAFLMANTLAIFVRNDKSPKLAMWSMLAGNMANVIFDYIFIFILGWGMKGAAIATTMSPVVTIALLSTHFIRGNNTLKVTVDNLKIDIEILKRIFKNGFPSFIMEMSNGLIIFAFNMVIGNLIGSIGVSSYSIIANISLICVAIFNGIAQAIQPIISINYGAQQYDRAKKALKLGVITAFSFGIVFYGIGFLFPELIVGLFSRGNEKLTAITVNGIGIYFVAFLFMGSNISMVSYFQSIESSKSSTLVSMCRGIVFVLISLLVLPKVFGINGVWATIPISELASIAIAIMCVKKTYMEVEKESSYSLN
ncbi:MATE family efflux transporter [Clostridium senegalense]|uniref:MATE family efflux transporter n=1 Tax=Clostridium senegalense TaxID=1465809 RepID=UPI000289BE77|nr:MATE family efflux transporter [Clostridium senegalense]